MQKRNYQDGLRVVFTGGHAATTAIAVIDEIRSQNLIWNIYWIGAKHAVEGKRLLSLEYQVLPTKGVVFLPLIMGRLQRKFTGWTIPSLLKIPAGFIQSFYYLIKIRPRFVLSFGGFSSYPVVFAAKILGIPIIIHEQTAAAGRANLAGAALADKIALSHMESNKYFPARKIILTGNPVSRAMFSVKSKVKLLGTPVIFITGGSRGSQSINSAVEEILPELLKNHKVIHQTGAFDFEKFIHINETLTPELRENYNIFSYIDPSKITGIYEKADLIISRAGANTVSEILAARRPAIVIPLSISFLNEQTRNAEILVKAGFGEIISQKNLSGETLLKAVGKLFYEYPGYLNKIKKFAGSDKNAAEKLVNLLKEYVK